MINILVTGAGGGVGQGVIKSLNLIKDLSVNIYAADMSEFAAGLYFTENRELVPPISSSQYIEKIISLCQHHRIDYYIPGTDLELELCAQNREQIYSLSKTKVVVSGIELIKIGNDKLLTADTLKKLDFPFAKTINAADWTSSHNFIFPVIVKPKIGCRSIGVSLEQNYIGVENRIAQEKNLVIQEHIGNPNNEYTCTVVVCRGRVIGSLALKRDLRSGDTFRAFPVNNEGLTNFIEDLALKLNVEGSINIQLRMRDNEPVVFELNCRFSGTTPFCSLLGFNPVEAYIKSDLNIKYKYAVDYDSIILRNWQEKKISKKEVDDLIQ